MGLDYGGARGLGSALISSRPVLWVCPGTSAMKVRNSLRSLKTRHKDCKIVRRRGRVYVINKTQRRFKARQG